LSSGGRKHECNHEKARVELLYAIALRESTQISVESILADIIVDTLAQAPPMIERRDKDIRYVDGVRDVCYLCSDTAEFGARRGPCCVLRFDRARDAK
jgi:hypothetical protein